MGNNVDPYLRSCRGVPPIPDKWTWRVTRALSGVYSIAILNENNELLSKQEFEPVGYGDEFNNENLLTTIRATYCQLFAPDDLEFRQVMFITDRP